MTAPGIKSAMTTNTCIGLRINFYPPPHSRGVIPEARLGPAETLADLHALSHRCSCRRRDLSGSSVVTLTDGRSTSARLFLADFLTGSSVHRDRRPPRAWCRSRDQRQVRANLTRDHANLDFESQSSGYARRRRVRSDPVATSVLASGVPVEPTVIGMPRRRGMARRDDLVVVGDSCSKRSLPLAIALRYHTPGQGLPTRNSGLAPLRGVYFWTRPVLTSAV